jgi:hypothetical protein
MAPRKDRLSRHRPQGEYMYSPLSQHSTAVILPPHAG